MLNVNGVEIDFDLTSPDDLRRYNAAGEKMTEAAEKLPPVAQDLTTAEGFKSYISYIEAQCKLVTDFIDEAFGNGVCNKLLGPKTSLDKLLDVCTAIGGQIENQGKDIGVKIKKYAPNRAARKAKSEHTA